MIQPVFAFSAGLGRGAAQETRAMGPIPTAEDRDAAISKTPSHQTIPREPPGSSKPEPVFNRTPSTACNATNDLDDIHGIKHSRILQRRLEEIAELEPCVQITGASTEPP